MILGDIGLYYLLKHELITVLLERHTIYKICKNNFKFSNLSAGSYNWLLVLDKPISAYSLWICSFHYVKAVQVIQIIGCVLTAGV